MSEEPDTRGGMSEPAIDVITVHYRSQGMLGDLVADLMAQVDVSVNIHIVECGDDGTVDEVIRRWPTVSVHNAHANLGYCGGNNLAIQRLSRGHPVLIVNPDVRLPDRKTLGHLVRLLSRHPE